MGWTHAAWLFMLGGVSLLVLGCYVFFSHLPRTRSQIARETIFEAEAAEIIYREYLKRQNGGGSSHIALRSAPSPGLSKIWVTTGVIAIIAGLVILAWRGVATMATNAMPSSTDLSQQPGHSDATFVAIDGVTTNQKNELNVRATPSLDGESRYLLSPNSEVKALCVELGSYASRNGRRSNLWVLITSPVKGWVSALYIQSSSLPMCSTS